ncbi:MAG: ATP-dependent DNA ligase [Acidimicrobiales bacterium]|nr:ATP-dependent DNA ligase [Acidimicrobiales bacterium]
MDLPVVPPLKPMLAKAVEKVPDGPMAFEPKWDGFRCIVFRSGADLMLGSRNERPLTRYFPELIQPLLDNLPERCVVDSELIVASGDALDFDGLQQRIHPAESRVNMLAEKTPAVVMVFDLLALGDESLLDTPFGERRERLEAIATDFTPPIRLTPSTLDREIAEAWFDRFEGAGLDGLIAKPLDKPYAPNKRTQFKRKHVRTADCVVAGFRIHKSGDGVGSLLLGLHDENDQLHHLGVAASFAAKKRVELLEDLMPYRMDDITQHPWAGWLEAEAHAAAEGGKMPGAPNRWTGATGRDHSWIPVRPERVVEVKYVQVTNRRFRGTTRMVRWRPDREADSCRFDQLVEPVPIALGDVFEPAELRG